MISISSLHLPAFLIYLLSFITISYAKTLGSPTDQGFQEIFQNCMNNDTLIDIYGGSTGFGFGRCPNLIDCVLSSASEGTKAGMSSGTSIASLIPTMLALIGGGPIELVRLTFLSPIRALVTCLFGVGLPSNLFAQLQRHPSPSGSAQMEFPASVHQGVMQFAFPMSAPRSRRTAAYRMTMDFFIFGLAAIMLWVNWRVGTMTMVTWRCEYRWLLFFWPVACVAWWLMAVGSLYGLARKVEVFRQSDRGPSSWRALLMMSYAVRRRAKPAERGADPQRTDADSKVTIQHHVTPVLSTRPPDDLDDDTLIVRVEFPTEAHWRWWNTAIQAVAVGIYLYATFVLCSVLFLTGQEAILYTVCMILSLSAIRIMTALL